MRTSSFEIATYELGNPEAERIALVLPGRLDTKDYAHIRSHVEYMASLGYFALSFDPPGTWESPGDIALYTSTNIRRCIDEVIELLGNRPTVIIGHSRGGSQALLSGTENPYITHMVAVMSSVGPTNASKPAPGEVAHSTRDVPPGTERTNEQKAFDLPYDYFIDQEQYDATELLKTCSKPKLFFYGLQDNLVKPQSVKEAYLLAAEPKMIHELNSEHDYRLHPGIISEVNEVIGNFLERYETA